MTTTKTLRLTFKNAKNKKVNLSLPDAAENLTEEEVKTAMNEICEANLFVKEEVDQYQAPLSAQYVERTVTSVFDDSERTRTIFYEIRILIKLLNKLLKG
ncbi:MAG: DUF2922 domain-containing protein [Lactobacillus gasseri]|nr:DUF2922 domain-containing protein [Lactobacillus gasseri]